MKLIVADNIATEYPELAKKLEDLIVEAMQVKDKDGKYFLPCPIEIDTSDLVKRLKEAK